MAAFATIPELMLDQGLWSQATCGNNTFDDAPMSPVHGKKPLEMQCLTVCSTVCPSSTLGSFSFESPAIASDRRDAIQASSKFSWGSAPTGSFQDLNGFFATESTHCGSPSTPRSPCVSPRALGAPPSVAPPCAPAPVKRPVLLQAFARKSLEEVKVALELDPEAAREPFWDQLAEPPICAAIRLFCCSEIVSLLLKSGASVEQRDVHGRTPLMLLHSAKVARELEEWTKIEHLLLHADANISELSCEQHATALPKAFLDGGFPSTTWLLDEMTPALPAPWLPDNMPPALPPMDWAPWLFESS